jgi:hypothetical protein
MTGHADVRRGIDRAEANARPRGRACQCKWNPGLPVVGLRGGRLTGIVVEAGWQLLEYMPKFAAAGIYLGGSGARWSATPVAPWLRRKSLRSVRTRCQTSSRSVPGLFSSRTVRASLAVCT